MQQTKDAKHPIEIIECGITCGWATEAEAQRLIDEQNSNDDAEIGDGAISAHDSRTDEWLCAGGRRRP